MKQGGPPPHMEAIDSERLILPLYLAFAGRLLLKDGGLRSKLLNPFDVLEFRLFYSKLDWVNEGTDMV